MKTLLMCRSDLDVRLHQLSLEAYGQNESALKIAAIMAYEAGDTVRDMVRIEDYPEIRDIYEAQGKVSLGDVLAMAQELCTVLGWDLIEVYAQGCQRAIDRCEEKLEGKDGF